MKSPPLDTTPDGWTVANLQLFRYLVDQPPPRPGRIWYQLRVDAHHWQPLLMWSSGFGLIAIGVYFHIWTILPLGTAILYVNIRLFHRCVTSWKHAIVYRGIIDTLKPHPLLSSWAVADARLENGAVIPVAFQRFLVADIMQEGKPAEIIFDYAPISEYGGVLGARPASR
ncbi:MAG: hypothetical protein ACJ8C4_00710 [Gemmataceae bacterium]